MIPPKWSLSYSVSTLPFIKGATDQPKKKKKKKATLSYRMSPLLNIYPLLKNEKQKVAQTDKLEERIKNLHEYDIGLPFSQDTDCNSLSK